MFYIAAVLNVVGALAFLLFSEVHLQPWAYPSVSDTVNGNTEMKPFTDKTIIVVSPN